jgi:hypothetical protein
MMSNLNCATVMMARLKLNLLVRIHPIGNIRYSLRNLESLWMVGLLDLSLLSVAYVLVILLHILTMNVLNNCCMFLMILFGV